LTLSAITLRTWENNPFFLLSFSRWRGNWLRILHYLLPDTAALQHSKKRPCFLVAIFPSLYKPRQVRQDGGLEAERTNRFEWYFLIWSVVILSNRSPFWVCPHPQPLRSVSGSSLSFSSPPSSTGQPPFHPAAVSYFGYTRKLSPLPALFIRPGGMTGKQEEIIAAGEI